MSLIEINGLALAETGPALSLNLGPGQLIAIYGPTRSGKSALLQSIGGMIIPPRGSIKRKVTAFTVGHPAIPGRTKVHRLGQHSRHANALAESTELMLALGMFERRNDAFSSLSPSEQGAAELIQMFAQAPAFATIDGNLDELDPWALEGAKRLIHGFREAGNSACITTNRPDLAEICDLIIVVTDLNIRFAGTLHELLQRSEPVRLEVETTNALTVRALCEPFETEIDEYPDRLVLRTKNGQQLAAKLLADGYGDVKSIVLQRPTVQSALLSFV